MSKQNFIQSKSLHLLWHLLWPQRSALILGLLALAAGSAVNLLIPELVRRIINGNFGSLLTDNPVQVALALIGIFLIQAIFFYWRSYSFYAIGQKVVNKLREQFFTKLLNQPTTFFDNNRSADLLSRLIADAQIVQDMLSIRLSVLIRYFFQVLVGIVLMCMISFRLSIVIASVLPVLVLVAFFLGRKLKNYSRVLQDQVGQAANVADESLTNIKLIKAFGQEASQGQRFASINKILLTQGLNRSRFSAFFSSFVGFLMNAAIVALLLYGVNLAADSYLSYGDLTAFLLYGAIVAVSFSFIVSSFGEMLQGFGALDRISDIIENNSERQSGSQAADGQSVGIVLNKPSGLITFTAVSFSYQTRESSQIFNDLNLELKPRSCTALVGPSGSGKSTLASLILGLYRPTLGKVSLDGTDISALNNSWFHSLLAYVPQDPALFAVSIKDNVRFGKLDATELEIEQACKLACVWDFANNLPQGLDTICGERGHQLSGGERQRVAIARAIIKKPLIIVLDEPTSALDAQTEEAIRQVLDSLKLVSTVVVIAHRLSTIRNADQLLVLENGILVEHGSPQVLTTNSGLYSRLLKEQALTQ